MLFIAFSGMQLWRDVPRYEWRRTLEAFPTGRLFVRDLAQYWYLRGLDGLAGDIDGSAARLREFLADRQIGRTICLGASTGGFAALIYGSLLGAAEVHAFSPVCFLPSRPLVRVAAQLRHGHWRLLARHIALRRDRHPARRRFFDIRPLIESRGGQTSYYVYFGRHAPDVHNARRLDGLPGVRLLPDVYPDHSLVQHLRDTGRLAPILVAALARVTGLRE